MQEMGVSGSDTHEARSVASDSAQWRRLVIQCFSRPGQEDIHVSLSK